MTRDKDAVLFFVFKIVFRNNGSPFHSAFSAVEWAMPAPTLFTHRLVRRLADVRKSGALQWPQPAPKFQVTF
jgi:S-adenosylmethionine synthetase